jgi:perosamine synthetase
VTSVGQPAPVPHSRPWLTEADGKAIVETLASGMVAEGEAAQAFEAAASEYLGLLGGVATPDGTAALYLALRALDVGPEDDVVVPTYVCQAVAQAVQWTGATPVLCDVGEDWCLNADTVRRAITRRSRAVIVVHTFGIVADTRPIVELGLPVVEDLAQAFGAAGPDGRAGGLGKLSIASFHATKCLTTGEGGMAFARDEGMLSRMEDLKRTAFRLPLSNLQSALGLSQLARYGDFLDRRSAIAKRYIDSLPAWLIPPKSVLTKTIHFRFPLTVKSDVGALMQAFAAKGVLAKRGVDALLHSEPGRFPGAERAFAGTLSLPIHPSMSEEEVDRVIEVSRQVLS